MNGPVKSAVQNHQCLSEMRSLFSVTQINFALAHGFLRFIICTLYNYSYSSSKKKSPLVNQALEMLAMVKTATKNIG
jgi:hypothetical protein